MGFFEPQTETVELYQGGWQQRLLAAAQAVQAAAEAANATPKTLDEGEDPEVLRLTDEYVTLREQAITEGIVRVTVKALPREDWDDLIAANPPREGDEFNEAVRKGDAAVGVNELALSRALVPLSISKVEPEMTAEELLIGINSAQFEELYMAAHRCNRGSGFNPKEAPALTLSRSSGETGN